MGRDRHSQLNLWNNIGENGQDVIKTFLPVLVVIGLLFVGVLLGIFIISLMKEF